jgi:hypothetical protein
VNILLKNRDKMFSVFELEGQYYMTAIAGGVAQYGITIWLSEEDARTIVADKVRSEDLAFRLTASPESFEDRRIRPSINP